MDYTPSETPSVITDHVSISISCKYMSRWGRALAPIGETIGDIRREKTFSFVRSNALFLAVKQRQDGGIEVYGDRPPQRLVDALIERGMDVRGTFRVWTNAKVVRHNAPQAREDGPQPVYQWVVKSLRDPPPSLILQLQ